MNKESFIIQDVEPRTDSIQYVVLQAGKGKTKWSSIYVSSFAFSYVEGLIWDKYREYSVKKKIKIPRNEWVRILDGMETAIARLETMDDISDIESFLKFSISNPRNALELISDQLDEFVTFFKELLDWLLKQSKISSNITIIKNYA
jgi:hypothetical protein